MQYGTVVNSVLASRWGTYNWYNWLQCWSECRRAASNSGDGSGSDRICKYL